MKTNHSLVALAALVAFVACAPESAEDQVQMAASSASVTMVMPVTSGSSEALDNFMQGQRALDVGRFNDALPYFQKAVQADPDFALGYLNLANASNSTDEFQKNLNMAVEKATGASEAEQLVIDFTLKGFNNDAQGQLEVAQRLVELEPMSPRAWLTLSNIQSNLGDEAEARASAMKAVEVSPGFAPAHMALGNSYLFIEPRDLAKSQQHMEKCVELEPNEATPHDLLGDTYRAQGQLEKAAEEYTRTAELDPTSGSGFQQRGHVHSFLGNYDQARADYDAAIDIEANRNTKVSFGLWRALVHVHEGNPEGAVDELNQLVGRVDAMGIPEPTGLKIFLLNNAIQIALHQNIFDAAKQALEQRDALVIQQATRMGTEAADRNARAAAAMGEANLAARMGEYQTAIENANEFMMIVEPNTNPRKNEPAHALMGFVSLSQGNYDEAIAHYEQANPNDIYVTYYHAAALEGAGRNEEAGVLFDRVANWLFNGAGLALVRKDAMAKVAM